MEIVFTFVKIYTVSWPKIFYGRQTFLFQNTQKYNFPTMDINLIYF